MYSFLFKFFALCLFSIQFVSGQIEWAYPIEGGALGSHNSMCVDSDGNVYVTGYFNGTIDIDPGGGSHFLTSNGSSDIYIMKLNNFGDFVWAYSFGGSLADNGMTIDVDSQNNVYFSGSYTGTADFDPDSTTFNLSSNGEDDIFILKLDSQGNFIWAHSIGGIGNDSGTSIATDQFNNVFLTGYFHDTVDFNPSGTNYSLSSVGDEDIFLIKYDSDGNYNWANRIGDSAGNWYSNLTIDLDGNSIITGAIIGGPLKSIYVQKFDPNGNSLWANDDFGNSHGHGQSVDTDLLGNIYVTGGYNGSIDLDPGISNLYATSNGYADLFIQKLSPEGNLIWAKSIGGSINDLSKSIYVTELGELYITGFFSDTVDFNPGAANYDLIADDLGDIFILKLLTNGNFEWAHSFEGPEFDTGFTITADVTGAIYLAGHFNNSVNIGSNITTTGIWAGFITKLGSTFHEFNFPTLKSVYIFPNPSSGLVNVEFKNVDNAEIEIYNTYGQRIRHIDEIEETSIPIELDEMAGIYFFIVRNGNEKIHFKIVVN